MIDTYMSPVDRHLHKKMEVEFSGGGDDGLALSNIYKYILIFRSQYISRVCNIQQLRMLTILV